MRLKVQERWYATSNKRDLLGPLKKIKSLLQKHDEDTEYHHVAYHTLLRQFMLFRKMDYSNSEYKQLLKEQIEVLEACNRGVLFGNIPGDMEREITMLGLDADTKGDVEKAQILARGK